MPIQVEHLAPSGGPFIAPSMLACDFGQIDKEVQMLHDMHADVMHLDIMDGSFVPNISYGLPVVKAMTRESQMIHDVHLMIERPEQYFGAFIEAGAHMISFHVEATRHVHRAIQMLKAEGVKAGLALNPHTPVETIFDVLESVDFVLIMSVNPGFGGQKFIYRTIDRVSRLKDEIRHRNLSCLIEVDGGVGLHNAEPLVQAGADILVMGSAFFGSENKATLVERIRGLRPAPV